MDLPGPTFGQGIHGGRLQGPPDDPDQMPFEAAERLLVGLALGPLLIEIGARRSMHDLCLPQVPRGARLTEVTIAGDLIQDPDGDPNLPQKFKLPLY
jgi:hypothetical protein